MAVLAAGQNVNNILHECEACHGGGQFHVVSPTTVSVPNVNPSKDVCAVCHDVVPQVEATPHVVGGVPNCAGCHEALTYVTKPYVNCVDCHTGTTPEIATKVTASMHNSGARTDADCQRCHSIEGFVNQLSNGTNPSADANYTAVAIELTSATAPTCAACHEPHNTAMRVVPNWDPNQNGVADQFDTCTACHNLYNNDGSLVSTYHHQDRWYRNIQTTHYDNPATGVSGTVPTALDPDKTIEGYVIRTNSANPCFDCHGHELRANTRRHLEPPQVDPTYGPTIYTDWANSAHAGHLLANKVAAIGALTDADAVTAAMSTGVTDTPESAWAHYNWDRTGRNSCQRCHTATGLSNFMANTAGYDYTKNDFSHLVGWSADPVNGSNQNELLYCWGCHSDAANGVLRADPNGITLDFKYEDPNVASDVAQFIMLPDKGKSNICGACHAGRGNDFAIRTGSRSFRFAGHHAPTAGTLYADVTHTAFEYTVADGNPNGYAAAPTHASIDELADGPCVSCHMSGTAKHNFEALDDVAPGAINNQTLCDGCHGPGGMTYGYVKTLEGQQADASLLLKNYIANVLPNYLNHDMNATWDHDSDPATDPVAFYTTDPLQAYGAFQNSLYVGADEVCAFVHNPAYARQVIFDSIDWMQDGDLDGTITIPAGYDAAAAWFWATTGVPIGRP